MKHPVISEVSWLQLGSGDGGCDNIGDKGGGPTALRNVLVGGVVLSCDEEMTVVVGEGLFSLPSLAIVMVVDLVVEAAVVVVVVEVEEDEEAAPSASEIGMAGKHSLSKSDSGEAVSFRSGTRL